MVRTDIIRGKMAEHGYTIKSLAKSIGICSKTLSLHLNDGDFGLDEVKSIMKLLEIDNPIPIFFSDELTCKVDSRG